MNEQQFALEVRKVLDESAEHLPYRVSHRLQAARRSAVQRMPGTAPEPVEAASASPVPTIATAPVHATCVALAGAAGGTAGHWSFAGGAPHAKPLWWRAAAAAVPLLLVVLGLMAIAAWHESDVADEMADVDLAVLTDEVPISAYADRGFGVFLKNSQQ